MRTVLFSVFVVVVFMAVSCMPPPAPQQVQPDGGVLGKVVTESDTQSTIKAWGQGPNNNIAFEQAKSAGAEAMAKDAAQDIRKAMMDSGWKQIVERTCALNMNTGAVRQLSGGIRWEGEVVCQRQQLLDWLNERGYGIKGEVEDIVLPKLCLVPKRLFGNIDNLEFTEDEGFVKSAALELLRDRNSGYQIDDYETLLRSWSSVRGQVSGDIDINPQFAVEADMYIQFNVTVDEKGGFVKASGNFEAIFVSTGETAANSIGNSESIRNTSGARMKAIVDCAKNGIDQIYEDMMKKWKDDLKNGFYYRIYFTGTEAKWSGKILRALRTLQPAGGKPSGLNKTKPGSLDYSVYVNRELAEPAFMYDAVDEALQEQGFKVDDMPLQLRHALGFQISEIN